MTVDRRVSRTRTALYDAIVALMREKPYAEIGVRDIVERANVGRSTFYAHFRSKDELLTRSLERLRPIFEAGRQAQQQKPRIESCESTLALFRHVHDYSDVLSAAEGSPARRIIVEAIEAELARFLAPFSVPRPSDMPRDLVLRFVTGTFVSVMSWWLGERPDLSAEEADRFFHRLVDHGIPAGFFGTPSHRRAA
jgi:AcrR family transcriptional regulator